MDFYRAIAESRSAVWMALYLEDDPAPTFDCPEDNFIFGMENSNSNDRIFLMDR
jgi:hypothetical protein